MRTSESNDAATTFGLAKLCVIETEVEKRLKLLTFLGLGRYDPVEYRWGESDPVKRDPVTTRFFAEAAAKWLDPDVVVCFVTPAVNSDGQRKTDLQAAIASAAPNATLNFVPISNGDSESDLWDIFDVIVDNIQPGERVAIDVTHGFRSLPILGLLAAAYIAEVKACKIERLIYGRLDETSKKAGEAIEITPFLSLLDWLIASRSFKETGDARPMAKLLQAAHQSAWRTGDARPMAKLLQAAHQSAWREGDRRTGLPEKLKDAGKALDCFSKQLLLARPDAIEEEAASLGERLEIDEEAASWARPFVLLAEETRKHAACFLSTGLRGELNLIEWYVQHGHLMQAITLSREWLVSYTCEIRGLDCFTGRAEAETILNAAVQADDASMKTKSIADQESEPVPPGLINAWGSIRDMRNEISHCGKRMNREQRPVTLSKIENQAEKVLDTMKKLVAKPQEPCSCLPGE